MFCLLQSILVLPAFRILIEWVELVIVIVIVLMR